MSIEMHLPTAIIVKPGASRLVGLELSTTGAVRVALVADDGVPAASVVRVVEGLLAVRRKLGVVVVNPGVHEIGRVGRLGEKLRGVDALVAVGAWPALALSKFLHSHLGCILAAVPMFPGFVEAFSRATVPPRAFFGRPETLRLPDIIAVDPELPHCSLAAPCHPEVEVLLSALEALSTGWRNDFVRLLAEEAIRWLERAVHTGERSSATLLRAAVYAAVARGHAGGSALSSLARALHALFGIDPYAAELALAKPWAAASSRAAQSTPVADVYGRALSCLSELLEASTSAPTLSDLGLKESGLDLVVEYAWTYERYYVEGDPAATSKLALRQLLADALG